MVLREKLKSIKMAKGEVVISYLTRISQVRDELAVVGVVVTGPELVRTALNGVTTPWAVFVQGLVARENLPSWDRVCDDFVQEELGGVFCCVVLLLEGRMRRMWP